MSPSQMTIFRLGLVGKVLEFAKALARSHPDVVFTSGIRERADQAHAMASNIVAAGRDWVEHTYLPSRARTAVLIWLRDNPSETTVEQLTAGILSVLDHLTNAELGKLSKHFSGEAVDIQPVGGGHGAILKSAIVRLCDEMDLKFIEREGGLERWHVQVKS